MASTLSPARREFSEDPWSTEELLDTEIPADLKGKPSLDRRAARLLRYLIVFCIGAVVTLGWQSYSDATREMIVNSYPQLGWLAPQTAALAQTAYVAPTAPPIPSADGQQLKAILLNLAAVRQSVDQLTAQLASDQQQMAGDIAKLQAAQQDILDKISAPPPRPAAAPARKPAPLTPQPSSMAPPVR